MRPVLIAASFGLLVSCLAGGFVACVGEDSGGDAAGNDAGGVAEDAAAEASVPAQDGGCASPSIVCTAGSTSACVDVTSDPKNCGACNNPCDPGLVCVGSKCTCASDGGVALTACSGPPPALAKCVDLQTDDENCGACNDGCLKKDCANGTCARAVFLSHDLYTADFAESDAGPLDPLKTADAFCESESVETNPASKVPPGTYKAWLGANGEGPADRFTKSDKPYVRPDGVEVAANFAGLTSGTLESPIDVDEFGAKINAPLARAMTDVSADGTYAGEGGACSGWTTRDAAEIPVAGDPTSTTSTWTDATSPPGAWTCGLQYSFYCVQQ